MSWCEYNAGVIQNLRSYGPSDNLVEYVDQLLAVLRLVLDSPLIPAESYERLLISLVLGENDAS